MFTPKDTTDVLVQNIMYSRINLIKENLEFLGLDFEETENNIIYTNYLAALPDTSITYSAGLSFDPNSTYTPGDGKFDVIKCLNSLVKNSFINFNTKNTKQQTEWDHCCAKHIRLGLEAGGINTAGNPVSAVNYVSFLPKKGFKCIYKSDKTDDQITWANSNCKLGDIAVSSTHKNKNGHICMFMGVNQWIADAVSPKPRPYSDEGICWIFRYGG